MEITTATGFTGKLNSENSWIETITGLPKTGMYSLAAGDPIVVSYRYYVTEDLFGTYTPVIRETSEGSENWIINNVAPDEQDRFTSVNVSKLWKENGEAQTTTEGHDDENITVKLTQYAKKVIDADKVTVTLKLIDADGTTYTRTQKVNKGKITLRVSRPIVNNGSSHTVKIDDKIFTPKPQSGNTAYYDYSITVNSDTTITAKLNYSNSELVWLIPPIYSTSYDRWEDGSNTATRWSYSLTDSPKPIDEIIKETLANTDPPVATQEYTYTLTPYS